MEQESIDRLKLLHPKLVNDALAAYERAVRETPAGVHPFITETLRSFERSDELYALGRTVVNPDGKSERKPMGDIVSNSEAGESYHNYGLALDFDLEIRGKEIWRVDENWMTVVHIFKEHGWEWGGDWKSIKDCPHLQKRFGYTWRELLQKHNDKDFIPGTQYLNL